MSTKKELAYAAAHPDWRWNGRSLANYVAMHPKAENAKTLTAARKKAFGEKKKTYTCRCGQPTCARANGGSYSSCNVSARGSKAT